MPSQQGRNATQRSDTLIIKCKSVVASLLAGFVSRLLAIDKVVRVDWANGHGEVVVQKSETARSLRPERTTRAAMSGKSVYAEDAPLPHRGKQGLDDPCFCPDGW